MMLARCDGENLGEIQVLQLSKQELIFGPMQIAARINQDQNISKDLSLWNQQGSQVVRGQTLVLPVENTFLYVEPIYIQATEARMPQLRKVVLAEGNTLIYADTYEEALAQLSGNGRAAAEVGSGADRRPTPGSPLPRHRAAPIGPAHGEHSRAFAALSGAFEPGEVGRSGQGARSDRSRGAPIATGGGAQTRTADLRIMRPSL